MSGDEEPVGEPDEGGEEEQPSTPPPPEPTGPVPSPPEELPKTTWMAPGGARGVIVSFDGAGVQGNAVDVRAPIRVLEHLERLVRIIRLHRSGLEVKRRGRLTEVQGAPRMLALPAFEGSYVVRLELALPEGELVVADHEELEGAVQLLDVVDDENALLETLLQLPERVGDELIEILKASSAFAVDLDVRAFRDGTTTATSTVRAQGASARVGTLEDATWSEPGIDRIRGTLFRIDTKRAKIAVDAETEDDEGAALVVEASFPMEMLEDLKAALRHRVEIEVSVLEERRRYERSARDRTLTVTSVVVTDD